MDAGDDTDEKTASHDIAKRRSKNKSVLIILSYFYREKKNECTLDLDLCHSH